jgi:hypothetical protein
MTLKIVKISLQKTIIWIFFWEREQKWKIFYIILGLSTKLLKILMKTQFASWFIMFQQLLVYWNVLSICYGQQ